MARIADQKTDFPQWYLDVIAQADLAEHAEVRGCIIFKPYGYALWEAIQHDLNQRIKDLGVDNVYFPLLIPESILQKEKDHIEGFAPECAVVTHGGGKELTENSTSVPRAKRSSTRPSPSGCRATAICR